ARLDRAHEIRFARVELGDFGCDPQFTTSDAARADAFADELLGAVFARGVDVAITAGDCGRDQFGRAPRKLHCAVADRRHLRAMRVQRKSFRTLHSAVSSTTRCTEAHTA